MSRRIATHVAVLLIGLMLGVGAIAVASPERATSAASGNGDVVRELRTLGRKVDDTNRKLDAVNRNLGGSTLPDYTNVIDELQDIDRTLGTIR